MTALVHISKSKDRNQRAQNEWRENNWHCVTRRKKNLFLPFSICASAPISSYEITQRKMESKRESEEKGVLLAICVIKVEFLGALNVATLFRIDGIDVWWGSVREDDDRAAQLKQWNNTAQAFYVRMHARTHIHVDVQPQNGLVGVLPQLENSFHLYTKIENITVALLNITCISSI